MKKAVAYTATAVLLGFFIMMGPLALQTGPPTYEPKLEPQLFKAPREIQHDTMGEGTYPSYGSLARPSNLLPSGLILLSGLIVAVGVYIILKKRVI